MSSGDARALTLMNSQHSGMARGEARQAPSLAESFGQPMTVGEGRIHFLQDHGP